MRRPALLLAAPLLALALAGCSSSDEAPASDMAAPAAARDESGDGAGGTTGGAAAAPDRARVTAVERAVVRTATLVVEVEDVRRAADSARALALGAGGELSGEQSASGTGDRRGDARSVLTLRVPGTKLDATVTNLAKLGVERERGVSSDDVTEQLLDLDSRVATQRASVARVRALLERASGLGDVVKIEGELAKREAELESLTARMRGVEDRVAMSTITLTLVGDGSELPSDPEEQLGFTGGLRNGWDAFTSTARVVAATAGALLPFLPFLLLALWAARRWAARGAVAPAADTRA